MNTALEVVLWASAALIVWTQLGYAAALACLARAAPGGVRPTRTHAAEPGGRSP